MPDAGELCGHLVYFTARCSLYFVANKFFMVIWYIFPHFGMLYHEKSGNTPADQNMLLILLVLSSGECNDMQMTLI
jgi:hypothetical protein